MDCAQPASWLCIGCVYELDEPGALCEEHVEGHPHEDYGEPVPLVNSPGVGCVGNVGRLCRPTEPMWVREEDLWSDLV